MQMTGHKTRSVFERYNIVSECDLVEAAKKLNAMHSVRLKPDTTYKDDPTNQDCDGLARRSAEGAKAGHNPGTVGSDRGSRLRVSL
jgi:ribonuclease HI